MTTAFLLGGSPNIVIGYSLRKVACTRNMDINEETVERFLVSTVTCLGRTGRAKEVKTIGREDANTDQSNAVKMDLAFDKIDRREHECCIVANR